MAERVQRRLAAVVSADVVGYSRLMEADEVGTLARLKALRAEFLHPTVAGFGGRIVKTTGDGTLIEYPSAVDAVLNALEIQREMARRTSVTPKGERIELRIGINLGDIVVEDDDIHGDGVNVAARLEALAEPGGICISGTVYDHVAGKVEAGFDDLGSQAVKNITRPIRVLRVREKRDGENLASVSTPVPGFQGRPAIAVLPFENLSSDPDQEYFADGIVEDIITRLSMWRWCPVIARNSTFAYKGRASKVQQVADELGARYVLDGSVRRGGDRIRITAQLVDAETGHQVWGERYDRKLEDIFDLQDEIVDTVVTALEPTIVYAEIHRARAKRPENLDAWEIASRGTWHFTKTSRADMEEAIRLYQAAVKLDPTLSYAWSFLTWAYYFQALQGWESDPAKSAAEAEYAAQMAIANDDRNPIANASAGWQRIMVREYDAGLVLLDRAVELNPSYAIGHNALGAALTYCGRPEESVEHIQLGMRLSPNDGFSHGYLAILSKAYYQLRQYDRALEAARKAVQFSSTYPMAQQALCQALAMLGRQDEAKTALTRFLELSPEYSVERLRATMPFRYQKDLDHFIDGLRRAGWTG